MYTYQFVCFFMCFYRLERSTHCDGRQHMCSAFYHFRGNLGNCLESECTQTANSNCMHSKNSAVRASVRMQQYDLALKCDFDKLLSHALEFQCM
ncbi:hypothetical protein GDO86_004255 [Hymenochirus boettgeri]|uniref:Uncharacterized protein n=1 Tax=Hymenochirus boettgeri TaxID=247094 RepID=A0A8T2K7J2_9PIPI|nr:hypothetical protein GDO86_004255 [Hymenochirus boettgeri]